jgi:2-polyprenyl-3-methyl-5-hydroxy-6-metoxy-1,4-benzoquinol methylase
MVRCAHCAFVYVPEAPDYDELTANLAWEKTATAEKKRRAKRWPRARAMAKTLKRQFSFVRQDQNALMRKVLPQGHVLDIGCGDGRVPEPFVPYGIEISESLCRRADQKMRTRGGFAVNASALDGLAAFDNETFDGIVMRSYLEHEDRPREVLQRAFAKLKPGGVLFVRVPNFGSLNARILGPRWCGIRLPDHLNYFTNAQLRALAERAGYQYRLLNRFTLLTDDNIKALLVRTA